MPLNHHSGHDDQAGGKPVQPRQGPGEVRSRAQLRYPEANGAHAGGELALAVAVSPVAGLAGVVGLCIHDLVDQRFGHRPNELGHVRWRRGRARAYPKARCRRCRPPRAPCGRRAVPRCSRGCRRRLACPGRSRAPRSGCSRRSARSCHR